MYVRKLAVSEAEKTPKWLLSCFRILNLWRLFDFSRGEGPLDLTGGLWGTTQLLCNNCLCEEAVDWRTDWKRPVQTERFAPPGWPGVPLNKHEMSSMRREIWITLFSLYQTLKVTPPSSLDLLASIICSPFFCAVCKWRFAATCWWSCASAASKQYI